RVVELLLKVSALTKINASAPIAAPARFASSSERLKGFSMSADAKAVLANEASTIANLFDSESPIDSAARSEDLVPSGAMTATCCPSAEPTMINGQRSIGKSQPTSACFDFLFRVIKPGDLILYFRRKTNAVNSVPLLQPSYCCADLRDLADRRPRKSVFDIDQVLSVTRTFRVKIVRTRARSVFRKIIYRIKAGIGRYVLSTTYKFF